MKQRKTLWRLWCYSLGAKSGKNDKEANVVSIIRTFIFATYLITNVAICLNAWRHWNDNQPIEIYIHNEVPSPLPQAKKERNLHKAISNFSYD